MRKCRHLWNDLMQTKGNGSYKIWKEKWLKKVLKNACIYIYLSGVHLSTGDDKLEHWEKVDMLIFDLWVEEMYAIH